MWSHSANKNSNPVTSCNRPATAEISRTFDLPTDWLLAAREQVPVVISRRTRCRHHRDKLTRSGNHLREGADAKWWLAGWQFDKLIDGNSLGVLVTLLTDRPTDRQFYEARFTQAFSAASMPSFLRQTDCQRHRCYMIHNELAHYVSK